VVTPNPHTPYPFLVMDPSAEPLVVTLPPGGRPVGATRCNGSTAVRTRIGVVDMDGRRIDTLLVQKVGPSREAQR